MKVFVVTLEVDKKTVEAVPALNSIALLNARPIWNTLPVASVWTVPLVWTVSCYFTVVYASVSPLTNPTSGVLYKLVILTYEPISNRVIEPLAVSNSLALLASI